jgi:hypothetical protein
MNHPFASPSQPAIWRFPAMGMFPWNGCVAKQGTTLLCVLLISKEAKTYAVWSACLMALGGEREGGWVWVGEESIGHQLNHGCGCKG